MTRLQLEYTVATLIMAIFIALLANAILHARASVRDDLRRSDLTNLKRSAELYFNQHDFFPTPPEGQLNCTESSDKGSWLFGNASPLLKEQHIDAIPHDVREWRGRSYRYCATKIESGKTVAFYFEAELESNQSDAVDFDSDPNHNFYYRILHENNQILYRVCGGTETQCTPK